MEKPKFSFWQIWNMNFGFLRIQFGFALQNANTLRIFKKSGAANESVPILWIAAPESGSIFQPIYRYFSDRTWNCLGRRKPHVLVVALLASITLFVMPNSTSLMVAAGMIVAGLLILPVTTVKKVDINE
jgi:maltose/moltooligosaccharide transporter